MSVGSLIITAENRENFPALIANLRLEDDTRRRRRRRREIIAVVK